MALKKLKKKNLEVSAHRGVVVGMAFACGLGTLMAGPSIAVAQTTAPTMAQTVARDAATVSYGLPGDRLKIHALTLSESAPGWRFAVPVGRLQLATLMTLPGQRANWRPQRRFTRQELLDLSLSDLRRGQAAVPPVFLDRFPANLADLRSAKQRKDIFIKTVLPLVLRANHEVRMERQRMLSLIMQSKDHSVDQGGDHNGDRGGLSVAEQLFLDRLAAEYEVSSQDLDELQQRVDVIPASLALAQGAEESGWGTSRFARLGNAVFGQRTFRKGGGLVPLRREQGQRHEVKSFNSLYTSVRAYVWNLNTHFAYKKFRAKRAAFRDDGQPLDGYALTGTLERYSERGQKYIKTIQIIMRANRLDDFDDVELLPVAGNRSPS